MSIRNTLSVLVVGSLCFYGGWAVHAAEGTAKGETSDEKGQQGHGLTGQSQSSNVIMGGPEIVVGFITNIAGEEYTVHGDRGQDVTLRVTKDTNQVCTGGSSSQVTTGIENDKEHKEIAPTPFMKEQAAKGGPPPTERQMMEQLRQDPQGQTGALAKDPTKHTGVVGSTDPKANEDLSRGSGFKIGDCHFKVGDHVRIEGADHGKATTIQTVSETSPAGSHKERRRRSGNSLTDTIKASRVKAAASAHPRLPALEACWVPNRHRSAGEMAV